MGVCEWVCVCVVLRGGGRERLCELTHSHQPEHEHSTQQAKGAPPMVARAHTAHKHTVRLHVKEVIGVIIRLIGVRRRRLQFVQVNDGVCEDGSHTPKPPH